MGIRGLHLSNNAASPHDTIDVAVGSVDNMTVPVSITKCLASRLPSTGYHVFLIGNALNDEVDVIFSTSATHPVMPDGWTKRRRVGSFMTNAASHIRPFVQEGQWFRFRDTPPWDATALALSATTLLAISVPLGIKYEVELGMVSNGLAGWIVVSDPEAGTPLTANATNGIWYRCAPSTIAGIFRAFTDHSRQVYVKDEVPTATLSLNVRAYRDHRDEYL